MKKLYETNELTFAITWIVVYCILQSLANPINDILGIQYAASAVFCFLQAAVLFAFIRKNRQKPEWLLPDFTSCYDRFGEIFKPF